MDERLEFSVLGPLEVRCADQVIDLGAYKQRALLALLLIRANRVVSTDHIAAALWGDEADDKGNAIWVYVSRLRSLLEPDRKSRGESSVLLTKEPGYLLAVERVCVDFMRFEDLLTDSRELVTSDPARAAEDLDHALGMWRGEALADFTYESFARNEITRLEELALEAQELRFEAGLQLGRSGELVTPLEVFTREHPYRERPVGQLMMALYRSGRQAEALRVFERYRRIVGDELGIEPSPTLRLLEEQILLHDDRLIHQGQRSGVTLRSSTSHPNPYKGLHAFDESDETTFFGRERLVAELLRRLDAGDRLIAAVGPSGSGKSSAVRAGFIPRVRKSPLPGGAEWVVAQMVPGAHPFAELEAALLRTRVDGPDSLAQQLADGDNAIVGAALRVLPTSESKLLLVIDQFEELFTLLDDRDVQGRFLEALLVAVDEPHGRINVVLTLRADFYDRPLLHPRFGPRLGDAVINVTPLTVQELEEAASRPAASAEVRLEAPLLARLVADVADQPGALPMFQYTLTELYERRDGNVLLESAYDEMGGLRGAITHRAEDVYRSLEPGEQSAARQLLLRLVAMSDEQTWGRRRVRAAEIISLDIDVVALQIAIDRLGAHRLLSFDRDKVTGSPTVEVGHEALLTEWPRLQTWIERARLDLLRHSAIVAAVDEWERSGRDPGFLVTGARLEEYEAVFSSSAIKPNKQELEFLAAAVAARGEAERLDHEREEREASLAGRARRRLWALVAVIATMLAAALVFVAMRGSATRVALIQAEPTAASELMILGLEASEGRLDVEFDTVEPPWTSVADVQRTLAEGRTDLIAIDGALDNGVALELAEEYPDTHFVVFFDYSPVTPPNFASYIFADDQAAFLAGTAAAMESKTGIVGIIGAYPVNVVDDRIGGFFAGARHVDPDLEILVRYLGDSPEQLIPGEGHQLFRSPELARTSALELYEEGADIVYHAAGDSGLGVFQAAAEWSEANRSHVWGIGADSDQAFDVNQAQAEHVLMSTIRRFDLALLDAVDMVTADRFGSGVRVMTLSNGGVDYVTTGDHLALRTVEAIDDAKQSIIDRTLVVDGDQGPEWLSPWITHCGSDPSGYGLVAGCSTLTVVTSPFDGPPYRFETAGGSLAGFEVDLLGEMARRLDLEVQYVQARFPNLIPQVADGRYDIAMNRLDVTDERSALIDFTDPYLLNPAVLVVNNASGLTSMEEVDTIVVRTATSFEHFMRAEYPDKDLIVTDHQLEARSMVSQGEVDGWVTEIGEGLEDDVLRIAEVVHEQQTAIAVDPELADLLDDMNSTLAAIIDDGTYDDIFSRWLDRDEFSVNRP